MDYKIDKYISKYKKYLQKLNYYLTMSGGNYNDSLQKVILQNNHDIIDIINVINKSERDKDFILYYSSPNLFENAAKNNAADFIRYYHQTNIRYFYQ